MIAPRHDGDARRNLNHDDIGVGTCRRRGRAEVHGIAPPQVDAVLVTDVGELAGMLTVSEIVLLPPAAMPGVPVQVTVVEPEQVKRLPVDVEELRV